VCLGRTHLLGGVALGLAAADAAGNVPLVRALALAAVAGGSALLNDLDTPSSTASHAAGRPSRWVASSVQRLAHAAFAASATPLERRGDPVVHRGLTHTLAFAAAVGAAMGELATVGPVGVGLVALLAAVPGARALGLRGISQALTALALTALVVAAAPSAVEVGAAVAVGLLSHELLDACTTQGVPLWWPLRLRGRRWRRVGAPRLTRFHTGGRAEPWVLWALVIVSLALLPPVLSLILRLLNLAVYNST